VEANDTLACTYAALMLSDAGLPITAEGIEAACVAAGLKVRNTLPVILLAFSKRSRWRLSLLLPLLRHLQRAPLLLLPLAVPPLLPQPPVLRQQRTQRRRRKMTIWALACLTRRVSTPSVAV
ncbi:60S acidic ribosomal protein P2, partial [Trypanosoma cruzi]